jgi:hypothetical protein
MDIILLLMGIFGSCNLNFFFFISFLSMLYGSVLFSDFLLLGFISSILKTGFPKVFFFLYFIYFGGHALTEK